MTSKRFLFRHFFGPLNNEANANQSWQISHSSLPTTLCATQTTFFNMLMFFLSLKVIPYFYGETPEFGNPELELTAQMQRI